MGALRAAELDQFGMLGVGRIYEDFRNGLLEDDDEVAVAHGGPDEHFVAQSDALVNIRTTLQDAVKEGIVSSETAATLIELIKKEFFPNRSYQALLQLGVMAGVAEAELTSLREWLPKGRRDQKKENALEMLHMMAQMEREGIRHTPNFVFQHTRFFERARRSAASSPIQVRSDADRITLEDILGELKLEPIHYRELRAAALIRGLCIREAQHAKFGFDSQQLQNTADAFRAERGLRSIDDTDQWLHDNELSRAQFKALMREQVVLDAVSRMLADECEVHMRSELRARGLFAPIVRRIYAKRALLETNGLLEPGTLAHDISDDDLTSWFFVNRLGMKPPGAAAECAKVLDFGDEASFFLTLRREYWYERLTGPSVAGFWKAPDVETAPLST